MHFTLAFIGEVPDSSVDPARVALHAAVSGRGAFDARFSELGVFPNARRPRVIWLGLDEGAEPVRSCALSVRHELAARGVPFDDKPPVAHLTVARLRDDVSAEARGRIAEALAPIAAQVPALRFRIAEAVLFQSRLGRSGPTYLPLFRVALD